MKFLNVCDLLIESRQNLSNVVCLNIEKGLFRLNAKDIKSAFPLNAKNLKNSAIHGNIFISRDVIYNQRQEQTCRRHF